MAIAALSGVSRRCASTVLRLILFFFLFVLLFLFLFLLLFSFRSGIHTVLIGYLLVVILYPAVFQRAIPYHCEGAFQVGLYLWGCDILGVVLEQGWHPHHTVLIECLAVLGEPLQAISDGLGG